MRCFKQLSKTKDGRTTTAKKYTIEVKDHLGTARKYPGCSDKRLSVVIGQHIELLAAFKKAGQPLDAQLCAWLQGIPDTLRNRLAKVGLVEPSRVAAGKPLVEHLDDYRQFIGDITKHAKNTHNALAKLFSDCKFVFWTDIQAGRLYNHLTRLRTTSEISQRTFNFRLKAAKAFCRWIVQDRRASESPVAHLKPITITKQERQRRALESDELRRLLDTTARGPVRFGMTGFERYLLYRFAAETGLRANEIRNLTIGDFDFDHLLVIAKAGSSKRKRQDVQTLRADTATLLKDFFKNKTPGVKAFGGTYKRMTDRTAEMIRQDLEAAGVEYKDQADRVFDFHSLRHETGTLLARCGVHPRDAQAHMRHSDINLTMKYYTHLRKGAESETAARLPDLSLPGTKKKQA
jgi:integrase